MGKMNSRTVVDSILSNLTLLSRQEIKVDERSFMAELAEPHSDPDGDRFVWEGFRWEYDAGVVFPFTKALFLFLWSCIQGLIVLLYRICEGIVRVFTGKDYDLRTSRRFNVVLSFLVFVTCMTMAVYMMVFLIKDVILFPMESYSNSYGTLTMTQPCAVEQYVRVLSSNECWAETGIIVAKGDEVRIAYSGDFYGEITDYHHSADSNKVPVYYKADNDAVWCMYGIDGEKDARFGSLLYQIKSESMIPVCRNVEGKQKICQIPDKDSDMKRKMHAFTVKEAGSLTFSVNDIYVHDQETLEGVKKADKVGFFKGDDSVYVNNPELLFADNLGEYLINVEVRRNSFRDQRPMFGPMARSYRWLYLDGNWLYVLMSMLAFFIADSVVGIFVRRHRRLKEIEL